MPSRHNSRRALTRFALYSVALSAVYMPAKSQNSSKNLSKAVTASTVLPFPADLRQVGLAANTRGEPLVLMVSLPGCPWCELLRRNYLRPMQSEGVAAYEFMVSEQKTTLQNFKAQRTTPAAFSTAIKITITPTLLFFDADGNEIASRIEGVASADFIGTVIDERLTTARERLKTAR